MTKSREVDMYDKGVEFLRARAEAENRSDLQCVADLFAQIAARLEELDNLYDELAHDIEADAALHDDDAFYDAIVQKALNRGRYS